MLGGGRLLSVSIAAKGFRAPGGGRRCVLRDVQFEGAPGEVLALFGPSGTGKTTTLRIALGLDAAFTGAVRRPPGRMGAVFQEPLLLPWLSVADNLRVVALPGDPVPDAAALLAEVGLPGAAARMPRELSLGMARRVALARALAVSPALLVLDEPFASLDAGLGAQLAAVVARRARRDGMLVLLATHDLDQALAIADRVLVLSGQPATLAADLAVPREGVAGLRGELHRRFPFLARAARVSDGAVQDGGTP
jgi:NitT/TauT family transport system ATP-binding protein